MERLTRRMCGGFGVVPGCELNTVRGMKAVVDRLAAYEDIGLSPEEIKYFLEEIESRFILWVEKKYEMPVGKFLDIMQAEKDGRMVVFPCKVGDTVYEANKRGFISTYKVICIHLSYCSTLIGWELIDGICSNLNGFEVSALGKTVFLNREEAETALKKREADDETD